VTTSGGGVWTIYSANPTNDAFGGLDSGDAAVWDTAAGAAITQTGDRYVFAYQPTLTVTTTNDTKTYGLTTTANGLQSDYTITGLYAGAGSGTAFTADMAARVSSGAPTISSTGTAASSNVGGGAGTGGAYAIIASSTGLTPLNGYGLSVSNAGLLTVNPESITLTATANSKVYDGGVTASATPTVSGTLYGGVSAVETYASQNVSSSIVLTPALSGLPPSTAADYTVAANATTGAIMPYTLTASLVGSVSKTYDSTNTATLTNSNYSLSSALGADTVSLVGPTSGSYASANAATGLGVTVSGLTLANNTAGDYQLAANSLSANIGTITPEAITVMAAGGAKVYDGGVVSILTPTVTSGTLYSGDATLSETYNAKDVNTATTLTPAETFASGKSIDYTVTTATAAGTITPCTLAASLTGSVSKTYDSTNIATLTSANYSLTSALGSDAVSLTGPTSGSYASANAAAGLGVTVSGLTLANNTAGDYQLASTSLSANIGTITPEAITIAAAPNSKVYDGGTAAAATPTVTGTIYGADSLSEAYTTANAGTGLTLVPSAMIANASNYAVTYVNSAAGTITPAPLSAALTSTVDKTYDGTTTATLTPSTYSLTGFIPGQGATVTQTVGAYASPNVGTGIGVSATLAGADFTAASGTSLSNYLLPTTASGTVGEIAAAPVKPVFNPNLVSYPANGTSDASANDLTRLFAAPANDGVANPGLTNAGQSVIPSTAPSNRPQGPVPIYPDNQWVSDSIHFKVGTR
jgi:hypothetical protein